MKKYDTDSLEFKLARLLNEYSEENKSDTSDWILATYLLKCLEAWRWATVQRDAWFNFRPWGHDKTEQALRERDNPTPHEGAGS